MNLTPRDWRHFDRLLRPIDLYNIRAFWLGAPLDDRGQWKVKELEEELLVKQDLPEFLIDYLDRYETTEDRLRYFSSLYSSLYREAEETLGGFLREYYRFERELSLILVALRAKKTNKDLIREMQFEDPYDPLVAYILAQKDALEFTPPRDYEEVKLLFDLYSEDPKELNRAILEVRFKHIVEVEQPQDFSIDRVLAYAARLLIAETLTMQNVEKGMEQLRQYE